MSTAPARPWGRLFVGFTFFVASLTLLNTGACHALRAQQPSDLSGAWRGTLEVPGATLDIRVVFKPSAGALRATIDIPQQGAAGLQLRNVRQDGDRIRFELPAGPGVATFDGVAKDSSIAGEFTQGPAKGTFSLRRDAEAAPGPATAPPSYKTEDVTFTSGDATLAGTVTLPQGKGPFAAIAMLTGSGPQNRDEEIFGFKPFLLIADHLTRSGVAVLRWDDRGVGDSTGAGPGVTTADFASDALSAVAWLKARPEIDPTRIGLLGHSEGGTVAVMAAAQSEDVAFIVMLAGSAVKGEILLRAQAEALARSSGGGEAALAGVREQQDLLFRAVRSGEGWDEVEALARKRAGADPARPNAALDTRIRAGLQGARSAWYRYFLDYDPSGDLAKVKVPVLALFGDLDVQVPPDLNVPALEAGLARAGNSDLTVKRYPGTNHLFIPARTGMPSEYPTLDKRLVEGVLGDISNWVTARTK